jgi:hypothetical protein
MEEKEKDALQQEENATPKPADKKEALAKEETVDAPKAENALEAEETGVASEVEKQAKAANIADNQQEEDEQEVESDEHEDVDEYASDSKEMPDYAHMPVNKLVAEASKLLKDRPIQEIKEDMEVIHSSALKTLDDIRNEKLHQFVEDGGNEIDFHYDQPQRKEIQDIYYRYKKERATYYKHLEEQLNLNLEVKRSIVEEIKNLPNMASSVPDKYNRFRELQERWHNTGPVPRAESNQLWNNYHHHVDNFYDFLRISNQLRELDFKKNLDAKTALCEEAEALAEKEADHGTFTTLQELHIKWKRIGPVDREHREAMWERFSEATKKVHEKRHDFFSKLREDRELLIERKRALIESMKQFKLDELKTHGNWQKAIKEMDELRNNFRQIGRINLPENDVVWEEFREVNRTFNRAKNAFYKTLKAQHHKNLERKQALLARAEELKDSDDWHNTANELKRIQADWKKIGYVPKSESDKIWKAFRSACNHFFDRLTEHNKDRDKEFLSNLKAKEELLAELKAWDPTDKNISKNDLRAFISRWKAAGRVPKSKRDIENEFNNLLDSYFKKLKVNRSEASLIRFENKLHNLIDNENKRELNKQEDMLDRKVEEAEKELRQLENNIQFFAHADENSPIVKEAKRNVERQKEQIELLKAKRKQLKSMRNKPKPAPEKAPAKTSEADTEKQMPEEGENES